MKEETLRLRKEALYYHEICKTSGVRLELLDKIYRDLQDGRKVKSAHDRACKLYTTSRNYHWNKSDYTKSTLNHVFGPIWPQKHCLV